MVEWNPYSWEAQHAPYPVYRRLRDEAPVYHNEEIGFWALSRYDDVLAAHLDTDTFSSAHGVTIEGIEMLRGNSGMIITKDPPLHTLHRRIVWRVFTPRRIADLEPFIRELAAELLDRQVDADGFDVVEEFSTLLPLHVIGELLGLPPEFRERLHPPAHRIIDRSSTTTR